MSHTLADPRVRAVLDRLFAAAGRDSEAPVHTSDDRSLAGASAAERADALREVVMPISAAGGDLVYGLVRSARPATVVEFGTSFGLSTIYLAAAVRDNGVGRVVTTELSAHKVAAARENLAGVVDVLPGDALETLAGLPGPVGLVLLDGWKDLCLPVLRLLEDRLTPGAMVVADDTSFPSMAPYLEYVRDPANGYVSVAFPVEDHMELSCRA
jgi:predicted O-methyltransferase YrrM